MMQDISNRMQLIVLLAVFVVSGLGSWAEVKAQCRDNCNDELCSHGICPPEAKCYFRPYICPSKHPLPTLYFLAEGLFLRRDVSGNKTVTALFTAEEIPDPDQPDAEPTWAISRVGALGTNDLDLKFQEGGRLLVGIRLSQNCGFEGVYFGSHDWIETAAVSTNIIQAEDLLSGLVSPFTKFEDPLPLPPDPDLFSFATISEASTLQNFEWNFRKSANMPPGPLHMSWLVGGRYMVVDERFSFRMTSPVAGVAPIAVATATDNDLIGAQLGAMFEYYLKETCWIDLEIKGALLKNLAERQIRYAGATTSYDNGESAFAGDLSLTFAYQVTRGVTFRAGYRSIWIDGLALASSQFIPDDEILRGDANVLIHDGRVAYHGPHLGLIVTW
jgi:hypothetical protein